MVAPLVILFCAACGTYVTKKVHDVFHKKEKNKKRKLELKGKTIDQAREDNKVAQKENDEWKKKYDELDAKIKRRDEEIKKFRNKLRDPNLSPEERNKINNQLAILIDQQENDIKERDSILDKIKKLGERIKDNNSIISGTASNLDEKHWISELFTLENIMIIGACYVAYKLLKEDNKR